MCKLKTMITYNKWYQIFAVYISLASCNGRGTSENPMIIEVNLVQLILNFKITFKLKIKK